MPLTDEQALEAHIRAVEARAKAEVCAVHIAGFASEFERRFQAWRNANSAALSRGAALAESKGMNGTKPPSLQSFARMQAQLLGELPEDDRQRRCQELLAFLVESGTK